MIYLHYEEKCPYTKLSLSPDCTTPAPSPASRSFSAAHLSPVCEAHVLVRKSSMATFKIETLNDNMLRLTESWTPLCRTHINRTETVHVSPFELHIRDTSRVLPTDLFTRQVTLRGLSSLEHAPSLKQSDGSASDERRCTPVHATTLPAHTPSFLLLPWQP